MKTFDTPEDAQKCERWATAWFCANAMPECVGTGQHKKIKQMCKSTCVNFFENCHDGGDLMARKNCQGLEEGDSCSAFDALIAGEKAQAMQAFVDSEMEQAFLDTVAETARKTSDKALPGVSYQSHPATRPSRASLTRALPRSPQAPPSCTASGTSFLTT